MVAPKIAAIIAREALAKFGDQLPEGVKETIGFIDSPKNAILSAIRGEAKERARDAVMGDQHQFIENYFGGGGGGGSGKPRFDEEGMSVEAFKRGGKVKAKPARRIDGIAQRGKTRGRYV
jgi:hypothetical protein